MNAGLRFKALAAATLSAASLLGCGADADGSNAADESPETGSLDILLSTVPSDAACVKIDFSGSRSSSKSFDLKTRNPNPRL